MKPTMNEQTKSTPRRRHRTFTLRFVGKLVMIAGVSGCLVAVAWWYLFFEQMLGVDVKAASECFYRTTVQCEVGNFVGLFLDTPPYNPVLLWLSGVVFMVGVLIVTLSPRDD